MLGSDPKQLEYIGVLGRAHGRDGALTVHDAIRVPLGIAPGCAVEIGFTRDFTKRYTVELFTQTEHRTLLKLREVSSSEDAAAMVDHAVFVRAEDLGVSAHQRYRVGDIQGCRVVDEGGSIIGVVTDVWILPANDVWVVTTPTHRTIPLPVIDDVIRIVDIDQRTITARLLDGLENVDTNEDHEPDA